MTDQDLRELNRLAIREPSSAHLDDDEWERLACGEMEDEERCEAFEHITACEECGRILDAVSHLESEASGFSPDVPKSGIWSAPRNRSRAPLLAWGGLAAAAVFFLWLLLPVGHLGPGERPPLDVEPQDLLRSGSENGRPQPLAPLGAVGAVPKNFSWEGLPETRGYRVELLDAAGEPVWTSPEVAATTIDWPPSTAGEPGQYFWRVLAWSTNGPDPVVSELVDFEIVDPTTPRGRENRVD